MVDMLAIAMEASRLETSSSGSFSSCLRVFTVLSRFSFWDWDLLRDNFTLSIDTLVSRWRRWANRESMFRYLQKNMNRNSTLCIIGTKHVTVIRGIGFYVMCHGNWHDEKLMLKWKLTKLQKIKAVKKLWWQTMASVLHCDNVITKLVSGDCE